MMEQEIRDCFTEKLADVVVFFHTTYGLPTELVLDILHGATWGEILLLERKYCANT